MPKYDVDRTTQVEADNHQEAAVIAVRSWLQRITGEDELVVYVRELDADSDEEVECGVEITSLANAGQIDFLRQRLSHEEKLAQRLRETLKELHGLVHQLPAPTTTELEASRIVVSHKAQRILDETLHDSFEPSSAEQGQRVQIPVAVMEFNVGGNTIWVHSPEGGTVLRIQTKGVVDVHSGCANNVPHADLTVSDNIHVCVPDQFLEEED